MESKDESLLKKQTLKLQLGLMWQALNGWSQTKHVPVYFFKLQ